MAVLVETNNDEKAEHRNEKVPHNYHDYANEVDDKIAERAEKQHFMDNFPIKLHYMLSELETDGMDDVVSWQPHGRSFIVHKQPQFVEKLLPLWFRQTKFPSFQRQLNLYGFKRITSGRDKGGYYNELFLRSKRFLSHRIQRVKVKGEGARKPGSPDTEPNFYNAPYLPSARFPWVAPVGHMVHSGRNMNVGEGSLQGILGSPALQQHQQRGPLASPPFHNNITHLQEFEAQLKAQLHPQQYGMVPVCQDMHMLPHFQQQYIPVVSGHQDISTMAMTLALPGANQDPAEFTGLPGFWRGASV